MTREQAIEIIRKERKCVDRDCDIERSCGKCDLMMSTKEPILMAFDMAIRALEKEIKRDKDCEWGRMTFESASGILQFEFSDGTVKRVKQAELEPCDDAISRAVLDEMKEIMNDINGNPHYVVRMEDIRKLPPVTPKPTMRDRVEKEYLLESIREDLEKLQSENDELRKQIEPCEDAISREAAIDAIEKWLSCYDCNETERHIMRATQSILYDLPSVTPSRHKGHWIPVSERLPEAGEYIGDVARYYLVQNEYGDMLVARYTHSKYWEQIYQSKPIGDEIIAWMPLPKPYEPQGSEV